jgi:nitronate monooxygenase
LGAGTSADIVYSNLFTGVHGNYLRGSIIAAGLDPDNLPESDPSAMDFGSRGNMESKAWKDIWGSGQGIATVTEAVPAAKLIHRLAEEYQLAVDSLLATIGRGTDGSPRGAMACQGAP